MPGARLRAAACGKECLDDAILERMEGDYDQTPRRREHALGGEEAARQFGKLVIDENPQRLKGAGRGMNRGVPRVHHARNDVGKRRGRVDDVLGPRSDDRPRDRPGMTFFAQNGDNRGEVALAAARNDICSARAIPPHAHIERAVEPE